MEEYLSGYFFVESHPKLNCQNSCCLALIYKNCIFFNEVSLQLGAIIPSCKAARMDVTTFIVSSSTIQMHFTCSSVNTVNTPLSPRFSKSHHFKAFISSFPKSCYKADNWYPTGNLGVFHVSLTTSQLAY